MRKLFALLFSVALIACQEDNATPEKPIVDEFDPTTATLIGEGEFVGVGHTVRGTVGLYELENKYYVVLNPFNSQNGPDLKVYLSKDNTNGSFINLGAMKSTIGKQTYEVTGLTDVSEYDNVLIWCQQFSVLFGVAEID